MVLCVAMASGSAMAWTTGDFNGSVDFGGSIVKNEYKAKWQWESGTGLNSFVNTVEQLTEDSKKLTITAEQNYPILKGKTTAAIFANPGDGAIPNISFSDYEGHSVSLNQNTDNAAGTGYLDLPIKDGGNQKIGTLRVNVTAGALLVGGWNGHPALASLKATNSQEAFYGGLFNQSIASGGNVAPVMETFGLPNKDELLTLVRQHPQVDSQVATQGGWANSSWARVGVFNETNKSPQSTLQAPVAAVYAMGVKTGQTLNATFNNPITSTTQWSAPLTINVTYN